jgi:hypothetical protein
MNGLAREVRRTGSVPLGWAGATEKQNYLNFGDALSPVMVAALAGVGIARRPMRSKLTRMSCVGTIAHGFGGGEVHVWGSGMSPYRNPGAPDQQLWARPADTGIIVHATRGPQTAKRLGVEGGVPYGDPVFLLPRFYDQPVEKTYELGVILHLSELESRELGAGAKPSMRRYQIPEMLRGDIKIINTLTEISAAGLERKIQEIRTCKRIVSLSLHGLVIAESYGIPCLYFSPRAKTGPLRVVIDEALWLDPRIADLNLGINRKAFNAFGQPREQVTPWDQVITTIDETWEPMEKSFDDLMESFPVDLKPLETDDLFKHPLIAGLTFQHNVGELLHEDAAATTALGLSRKAAPKPAPAAEEMEPPAVDAPPPAAVPAVARSIGRKPLAPYPAGAPLPVSWIAASSQSSYLNLGDALSPVIVACVSSRTIEHVGLKEDFRRIAAVGSIAHSYTGGEIDVWGSGSSRYRNPLEPGAEKLVFSIPPNTRYRVWSTRGPYAAKVLEGAEFVYRGIYGDPVWLLPRFYKPAIEKRWELGVIVHLADLANRDFEANVKENLVRYAIPEEFKDSVRIIHTVTRVGVSHLKDRLDEILSCKRLVSTSLHGMVIAESYGIPCLYFAPRGARGAVVNVRLDDDADIDFRILDLYAGLGKANLNVFAQPRLRLTDWGTLIRAIDDVWTPVTADMDPLVESLPVAAAPLSLDPSAGKLFEHPLVCSLPMAHDDPPSSSD